MSTGQTAGAPNGDAGVAGGSVGGLGEAGILRILNRRFATVPAARDWPEGTVGPGDDAAVVAAPDARFVISTDAMAQDRDFRLAWPASCCGPDHGADRKVDSVRGHSGARCRGHGFAGGYSIGWKAAAQNLSDINAMGAESTGLLLALTMPSTTEVSWIDGLAAGIAGAVRHLGARRCRIVGGDLGSDDRITLAITATGDLDGRPAVLRTMRPSVPTASPVNPASPATSLTAASSVDLVLCGRAGWAAAGLAVLDTPRDELLARLRDAERGGARGVRRLAALAAAAQLRPRPVLGAGRHAADAGALAMMDVSDGVAKDAGRLATANGRRAELDPQWIRSEAAALEPLARALDRDAEEWVASGGEDYGLLAVLPAGAELPSGFRRIGRLVSADGAEHAAGSPAVELEGGGGWDHFSRGD